jgi:hypothetical protein
MSKTLKPVQDPDPARNEGGEDMKRDVGKL